MCSGPRLAHLAEICARGSEKEVRQRIIWVSFNGPAQPSSSLLVAAEIELRTTRAEHPNVGFRIARAEAQRLKHAAFGFLGPSGEGFGDPDFDMRVGQVSV